jgi:hypothetical protein
MRLRIFVTACVAIGILLLLSSPWVLGNRPKTQDKKELSRYGVRLSLFVMLSSVTWASAAIGSLVIIRRTRKEFAEHKVELMRELIEGSLRDHEQRTR